MLMRHNKMDQSAQNTSAHIPIANGRAITKPRAKLDRRARGKSAEFGSGSFDVSSGALVLAILVSDLLRIGYKCQTAVRSGIALVKRRESTASRQTSNPVRSARHLVAQIVSPIRWLIHELADIVFVLRLLVILEDKNSPSAVDAIRKRSKHRGPNRKALMLRVAMLICLSLAAPRLALAQPSDVLTPIELFDPDAGDGVRISPSLLLFPQASAEVEYDSNIFNFSDDEVDDVVTSIRPRLVVRSDLARHALRLEAGGEIRRYLDTSQENSEQFRARAETELDFGEEIDVETLTEYRRGIERRGTTGDTFFSDEPVVFHDKRAEVAISREGNKLALRASAEVLKRDYQDTTLNNAPVDLSFRDVQLRKGRVRADFAASAKTSIFGEASVNVIDYENTIAPERDSNGFEALVGVKHEVSSLVEIEAGLGFIKQSFDRAGVKSAEGISYRLAASWTPKPVWRLTASATRTVDPSQIQESPAIITSDFRLGVERAVGDRLLLQAGTGYREEEFRSSPRKDERFVISAQATYRLTDRIGVFVSADYRDQDGGDFGRTYNGMASALGIRAAW